MIDQYQSVLHEAANTPEHNFEITVNVYDAVTSIPKVNLGFQRLTISDTDGVLVVPSVLGAAQALIGKHDFNQIAPDVMAKVKDIDAEGQLIVVSNKAWLDEVFVAMGSTDLQKFFGADGIQYLPSTDRQNPFTTEKLTQLISSAIKEDLDQHIGLRFIFDMGTLPTLFTDWVTISGFAPENIAFQAIIKAIENTGRKIWNAEIAIINPGLKLAEV